MQGESRPWIDGTAVEVAGESVVSVEPIEGSFRETSHLEPWDLMNPKTLKVAVLGAAFTGAVVTVYVLSGTAWVTPPDERSALQVEAGTVWASTASRNSKRTALRPSQWESPDLPRADQRIALAGAFDDSIPGRDPYEATGRAAGGGAGSNSIEPPAPKHYALNREGIRDAIQSTLPHIEECYSSWVQSQPQLGGRMVIGFQIGSNDAGGGSVQQLLIVDGGLGHALMEGCVMNAVQDVMFDEPQEPLTVNYPFLFSSSETDAGL